MEEMIKSLEKLESSIKTAETEFNSLGGQLKILQARLEKEYGVKTIDEAEALIADLERKAKEEEDSIKSAFSKLKETYEW